ncbi:contactin 1 [Mytilus galloprovincialis]|uniref:Contactin 1 n=1 Tax=Mytilus galloprovincialis TaxID=29158 RepID=A0A8B6E9I2_MYTGA|nr:contactin 1 [Mytilus galloprovincialis]
MWLAKLCIILGTVVLVRAQTVYYNCPDGWVTDQPNKRCYNFIFYPKLPYVLAAKSCAESFSSLVSVTTSVEHSFINEYLLAHDSNRYEWYTSGRKDLNNGYVWEGEGVKLSDVSPVLNFWMSGYQFVPQERLIYKFDATQNGYRWYIGQDTIKRAYICEIGQEEAYRVLIQRRDFTFGTPYLNLDETANGPIFDSDGVPENIWFLKSTRSLYLECLAIGYPQPTYKWLRGPTFEQISEEVKTATDSRYTLTNGKLTIQNPDDRDSRYYRCEASNPQGKIISNYAQLAMGTLGEFPNYSDAPVTAYAYEGAVVLCSKINFEPSVVYNWERYIGSGGVPQDIFVTTTPHLFISANGRLYFSEISKEDHGDYYCRVSLSGISDSVVGTAQAPSAVSRPIKLNVVTQASKNDWGPLIQDDFINVFPNPPVRGQGVRLECFAYGSAVNYKVNWNFIWSRRGGLPSKVKFGDFNRVLILENAQAEDEGLYTCLVTRGSGSQSKDFQLMLNTKPYFLNPLKHQHVDIGSHISWQCLADGNPPPEYSWYRNGTMILPNDPDVTIKRNVLTISTADPKKHSGMYQCGATNVLGQVLSSAQLRVLAFPPSFTKNPLPQSLAGAIRGNISIPCHPEASPRPSIRWARQDRFGNVQDLSVQVITGPIVDNTVHYRMNLNGDLVITNIGNEDEGTFICIATNDYGEDQSACQLSVQDGTTLFRKPNNFYRDYVQNDTVFINCEASYDPALDLIYVWKFNGKRIDMEKESYFFTQSFNPVGLYIKPLQYYHEGEYECTALTPLNSVSAAGIVEVQGVPEAPSGLYGDSGRVTTNSIIFYWTTGKDRGSAILEYEVIYNVDSEPGQWYSATTGINKILHADTLVVGGLDTKKRTYELKGLLPGNNYRFKIRAKNIKGWSEFSLESAYYQTLMAAPLVNPDFMNITGGGGSVGDLTIKWNPLPKKYHGGTGLYYRLYWRTDSTQVWIATNVQSKQDDLSKGQLYYVQLVGKDNFYLPYEVMIQARNAYGNGQNSTTRIIYSAEGMPIPAPKIQGCSAINSTAMDVYWTPIENTRQNIKGKIAGFQVNYWARPSGGETLPIYKQFIRFSAKDDNVPTHGIVIGITPNAFSIFDVQVFNTAGLGPKSDSYPCKTASDATILYPTEVRVHPIDSTSVKITWRGVLISTDEATIVGYKIFLWPSNENFRSAFEYMADFMPTEWKLSNLEAGVVYSIRISAFSDAGDGQKSPTVYFAIAGGATLIDQTVTQFSYLAASSISSSILLILLASMVVFMLS